MFLRKLSQSFALLGVLSLSLAAQADVKRYIVQFKSSATFDSVAKTATAHMQVAPGVMAPLHLFGGEAVDREASSPSEVIGDLERECHGG